MSEISVAYGSGLQALYAVEDSWGVLPSSPTVYNLRCTGFNVNLSRDSFTSNELTSDREIKYHRQGLNSVTGDISAELSYAAFDDLIAAALFSSWNSDDTIEIGTTQSSLRLQKAFPAIGQYHEFSGIVPSSWSLSLAPNSIVTTTFSMMGKGMTSYSTGEGNTADAMSGAIDKATNDPFDSFSGAIYEGGTTSGDEIAIVTGLDLTLENNIEAMQVIGSRDAAGLAEGRANITGTVTAYFSTDDLVNKFLNETESVLQFTLTDIDSNTMQFHLPRIKYSGSNIDVGGEGPVTLSLPFQALKPSTAPNTAMQISKI